MTFNLADLFESVVDAVPAREAIVVGERRLSYAALDARANRLASYLREQGVGPGSAVGLQLSNGSEYIEGMLAAFKLRAVPINVNYRYVEGELAHLFDDADLEALILHRRFAPRVAAIAASLPKLQQFLVVEDGSDAPVLLPGCEEYERALAYGVSERDFGQRSSDDHYVVYTGGTTGLPKGVVWRHEDIFFGAMGGGDPLQGGNVIQSPEELVTRIAERGVVALPTPPFMHAAAHWLAFHVLFGGGTLVLAPGGGFDPAEIWALVGEERVNLMVIVGDAMATPLLDAFEREPGKVNAATLAAIASGGALFSPATKERLARLLPGKIVIDGLGSSETGTVGNEVGQAGGSGRARFRVNAQTAVLDDALQPVVPGSDVVGRLARRGRVPLRYHKDPEKSATTFVEIAGERWALPGDLASVAEDGSVVLLGRASTSINSGGEKIFPEEVEAALKAHPDVMDAVVVGLPDPRWGQRVVAVLEPRPGATPSLDALQDFCRTRIAPYKLPRSLVLVPKLERSPAGKADYRWARERAEQEAS